MDSLTLMGLEPGVREHRSDSKGKNAISSSLLNNLPDGEDSTVLSQAWV